MSKSFSAKVLSEVLELFSMFMDKNNDKLIETLIREADVQVIAPAYRRIPFATWREAFDLVVPLYREYCEAHPDRKIVLMGDSAGGGLSAALAEQFKANGIRLPDELMIREELNHVYPLFPIPEAKPAVDKILQVVKR